MIYTNIIINMYALKTYMHQTTKSPNSWSKPLTWLKEEMNSATVLFGDFNTNTLPSILDGHLDRSVKTHRAWTTLLTSRHNRHVLKHYPTTAEYMFFLNTYGTVSKTEHMVGHKQFLINFKRMISYKLASPTIMGKPGN